MKKNYVVRSLSLLVVATAVAFAACHKKASTASTSSGGTGVAPGIAALLANYGTTYGVVHSGGVIKAAAQATTMNCTNGTPGTPGASNTMTIINSLTVTPSNVTGTLSITYIQCTEVGTLLDGEESMTFNLTSITPLLGTITMNTNPLLTWGSYTGLKISNFIVTLTSPGEGTYQGTINGTTYTKTSFAF
jgi:hypothetical protein